MPRNVGKALPSLDRLRELFVYDPITGTLVNKVRRKSRAMPGCDAGYVKKRGYVTVRIDGVDYLLHRIVWLMHYGVSPHMDIDHIDRDATNNRISNLRCVTSRENVMNRRARKNNSSGVTGVNWNSGSSGWSASIGFSNRLIGLGYFKEKADAIAVRRLAELMYHSPFRAE